MDVVRLVEEIKEKCDGLAIENDDVFMNTKFSGWTLNFILISNLLPLLIILQVLLDFSLKNVTLTYKSLITICIALTTTTAPRFRSNVGTEITWGRRPR